jgi:hypothetical protein
MHCRIGICLVLGLVIVFVTTAVVYAEVNMKEGKWEISGEMKLEGMPFPMPPVPVKFEQCLTKKDMVPMKREKNQDCKTPDVKTDGSTVTWSTECKDKNGVTESTGTATYKGDVFTSTMHTKTTNAKGSKTESTMKMSGKRIGDCN